jgi:hypothetical protein
VDCYYHYSSYHQLVIRAQTTVLNWCKEQLYIPVFICINCQSNKDLKKTMDSKLIQSDQKVSVHLCGVR